MIMPAFAGAIGNRNDPDRLTIRVVKFRWFSEPETGPHLRLG
ncbi:MAG: hypothetical protein ABIP77_00740 [Candidatus Limnocylindrales bacterium]